MSVIIGEIFKGKFQVNNTDKRNVKTPVRIRLLEKGGNAADAAAATLLALAITDYGLFAIGGEVPLIIYDAGKNEVKVLSGLGAADLS